MELFVTIRVAKGYGSYVRAPRIELLVFACSASEAERDRRAGGAAACLLGCLERRRHCRRNASGASANTGAGSRLRIHVAVGVSLGAGHPREARAARAYLSWGFVYWVKNKLKTTQVTSLSLWPRQHGLRVALPQLRVPRVLALVEAYLFPPRHLDRRQLVVERLLDGLGQFSRHNNRQ